MNVFTDYLWFNTKKRQEFVRITDEVAAIVKKSGVQEGMVLVSAMHITAGVYVNDWENGLIDDFQVVAREAGAGRPRLPAPPDRRGQRRRAPEAHDHGAPGHAADHRRRARSRPVGAGVLRRVRRPAQEARRRESDRRVTDHFDRVRALFEAVNGGDEIAIERLYHADADRGAPAVWRRRGGAAGRPHRCGRRLARVSRPLSRRTCRRTPLSRCALSAGSRPAGAGCTRSGSRASRIASTGERHSFAGYSHFLVEDGAIRRQRNVREPALDEQAVACGASLDAAQVLIPHVPWSALARSS